MTVTATDVQPDLQAAAAATASDAAASEGQGNEGTGLYSLDSIPESIREQVAPYFKEWDANVTREFQKRAESVKAWEPYDQLGVRDIAPEDMEHLVAFYQIASDEDAFKEWLRGAAGSMGLIGEGAEEPTGDDAAAAAAQAAGEAAGLSPEKVQQMIAEAIQQDRSVREQEQQRAEQVDKIGREVRETLDGFQLPGTPGSKERKEVEELVCFMAQKHQGGELPVAEVLKAGFADYQRMLNASASAALDEKVTQPAATALTGGEPNSASTPPATREEARARALARIQAANAA